MIVGASSFLTSKINHIEVRPYHEPFEFSFNVVIALVRAAGPILVCQSLTLFSFFFIFNKFNKYILPTFKEKCINVVMRIGSIII